MNVAAETAERSRSVAWVLKRAGRDGLGPASTACHEGAGPGRTVWVLTAPVNVVECF